MPKRAEVDQTKTYVVVTFTGISREEWSRCLAFVKALPNRSFDPRSKTWKVAYTEHTIQKLRNEGFEVAGVDDSIFEKIENEEHLAEQGIKPWADVQIPESEFADLRNYQLDFLRFFEYRNGRGLCGDEMGCGKTVQSLSYLKLHPEMKPVLIVVPSNVKLQWDREYKKWSGRQDASVILYGKTPLELDPSKDYIINWDILTDWKKELCKLPLQMIIGDEIQAIANMKSKRTKAFRELAKHSPGLIIMSGTPIRKRPKQFFSILNLIDPRTFGNEWNYLQRYCGPTHNGFGFQFNGATNLEELHKLITPLMIRREKKDILKELPEKIKTVVPLEITDEMKAYKRLEEEIFGNFGGTVVEQRSQMKQLSMSAFDVKEIAVQKWISDMLESCDKIIIFAWHNVVVEALQEKFKHCSEIVYGKMNAAQKDAIVHRFQKDPKLKMIIGNIQSLGTGVDGLQTVCSNVAFVEFPWSPADASQAEARLHRMGQQNPVNIYYLPAPETIDDMFIDMLDTEASTFEKLINGRDFDESDHLRNLMENYSKTRNTKI